MCNLQFRENVAAWLCFYERKDVFKGFLERVLRLKEVGLCLFSRIITPVINLILGLMQLENAYCTCGLFDYLLFWLNVLENGKLSSLLFIVINKDAILCIKI